MAHNSELLLATLKKLANQMIVYDRLKLKKKEKNFNC